MISIKSNFRLWERQFRKIPEGMQKVTARTLTSLAQQANTLQRHNLQDGRITLRAPKYALGSLRVFKAGESRPIARQDAQVGTFSSYLPVQDEGGAVRPKSGRARLVPTEESRGMNDARPVLRGFRLPRILPITRRGRKDGRPGGAFVIVRNGRPAVFIRSGRKARLLKVRHLAAGPSRIPAVHWHTDAVKKVWVQANLDRTFAHHARALLGGNT